MITKINYLNFSRYLFQSDGWQVLEPKYVGDKFEVLANDYVVIKKSRIIDAASTSDLVSQQKNSSTTSLLSSSRNISVTS